MKQVVLGLLLGVGLAVPLAANQSPVAQAYEGGCTVKSVDTKDSYSTYHHYDFSLTCRYGTITGDGSYDSTQTQDNVIQHISEQAQGYGPVTSVQTWTCSGDPWSYVSQQPVCSFEWSTPAQLSEPEAPESANDLNADGRKAFNDALQQVLKQEKLQSILTTSASEYSHGSAAALLAGSGAVEQSASEYSHASAAAVLVGSGTGVSALTTRNNEVSAVLAALNPDLQVRVLDAAGPHEPTIYPNPNQQEMLALQQTEDLTLQVRNASGVKADNVEVELWLTGEISPESVLSTSGGFTCTLNAPVAHFVFCKGGSLTAGGWDSAANIVIRVRAVDTTTGGFIVATVNPNKTISESDASNNQDVRGITIVPTIIR